MEAQGGTDSLKSLQCELFPKLHLLVSVYLTDETLPGALSYGKRVSPTQDKVNQFLSMIDSISRINFSSQVFYVKFDDIYSEHRDVVYERIKVLFPTARIAEERLDSFQFWKNTATEMPEETELILLATNHDHVFVGESVQHFNCFLRDLGDLGPRVIGGITHWSEMVGWNDLRPINSSREGAFNFFRQTTWTIGTCVVSKQLFQEWWAEDFTQGKKIIRPDNPFGPSVSFTSAPMLIPSREFFRHLDGYGHARVKSPFAGPVRACCSLKEGEVRHQEWRRGNYFVGIHKPDLPFLPIVGKSNNFRRYCNLVFLASAHTLNFRNLWELLNPKNGGVTFFKFPLFILLGSNRYFLSKIPKAVFRATRLTNFFRGIR